MNMLVETSKLRTAIVNLFPDTDIGLTRMRHLDSICELALTKAIEGEREACAKVAETFMLCKHRDVPCDCTYKADVLSAAQAIRARSKSNE